MLGFGCALTIKANVGMGAWDAMGKSIANIMNIEIGTAGILCNCICVFGQLCILRKDFTLRHLLQVPFCMLLGLIVNFATDIVFTFETSSLLGGIVLYLIANTDMCSRSLYGHVSKQSDHGIRRIMHVVSRIFQLNSIS